MNTEEKIKESFTMTEIRFLAYITQLSGTGHGGTENVRECTLRDSEASRGNLRDDIMRTNNVHYIYDNMQYIK